MGGGELHPPLRLIEEDESEEGELLFRGVWESSAPPPMACKRDLIEGILSSYAECLDARLRFTLSTVMMSVLSVSRLNAV